MATDEKAKASANLHAANVGTFAERVSALEKHFGSVAEIARRCGSSETAVRKWLAGAEPSRDRCLALAHGTGASLMWLVAGAPPMWAKDQSPHERDTQLVALGDPDSEEVRQASARRDQARSDFSAGLRIGMASDKDSQPLRLHEVTLAQAVGLLQGILVGRGELSPGDYAQALIGFYEVLSAPSEPNALAGKVIELSHFVAQRAKQGT